VERINGPLKSDACQPVRQPGTVKKKTKKRETATRQKKGGTGREKKTSKRPAKLRTAPLQAPESFKQGRTASVPYNDRNKGFFCFKTEEGDQRAGHPERL